MRVNANVHDTGRKRNRKSFFAFKNIVDSLRRAVQVPASQLAAGVTQIGGSFSIAIMPLSIQVPGGVANAYQCTIDVSSSGGFNGIVTLTESDALTQQGGSVGLTVAGGSAVAGG